MSCLYYYSLNDGNVEKYKISIDEEKLSKIKEKSIYKCGKKKKVSYEGVRFFKNNMYYSDFKEVDLGWREYKDGPEAFTCFHVELIDKITLEEYNKVINFINGIPFTNDKVCDLILRMKEMF